MLQFKQASNQFLQDLQPRIKINSILNGVKLQEDFKVLDYKFV